MESLIGKRIRADRGFCDQKKPWFGTVLDVYDLTVEIQFDHRTIGRTNSMHISEYNKNFFIIPSSVSEIEE
jgi:dTDP-4-dehydrorhamnose 3,5-epimerase-like enzyme